MPGPLFSITEFPSIRLNEPMTRMPAQPGPPVRCYRRNSAE